MCYDNYQIQRYVLTPKIGNHARHYRVGNGLIDNRRRLRPHGWMLSRGILHINACHESLRTRGRSQDSVSKVVMLCSVDGPIITQRLGLKHKTE